GATRAALSLIRSERSTIRERARAHDLSKSFAQNRWRAEADFVRQSVDRQVCRLEQALRTSHACASNPSGGRGADLHSEAPAQRARAHRRTPCDGVERQVLLQVLLEPRD